MNPVKVGVLTISDRCSRNEVEDLSGPAVVAALPVPDFVVGYRAIVPDSRKVIASTIRRWVDDFDCDVVLTTGGTGFSPRDVTPEATAQVIDRDAANLSTYLLSENAKITPFAALSRGISGIRKQTLVVNLPGSPAGARDVTQVLQPLLKHAVAILREVDERHPVSQAK